MLHADSAIIIIGDFNAHIGKLDLTERDKRFIGPRLYHDHCNDNGDDLKHILHLGNFSMKNTWARTPSVLVTWTNNKVSSQIDHLLCNHQDVRFRHIHGTWIHTVRTDHVLLSADIRLPDPTTSPVKRKSESEDRTNKHPRTMHQHSWDIHKLDSATCQSKYQDELAIGAKAILESQETNSQDNDTTKTTKNKEPIDLWQRIHKVITQASPTLNVLRQAMHTNPPVVTLPNTHKTRSLRIMFGWLNKLLKNSTRLV